MIYYITASGTSCITIDPTNVILIFHVNMFVGIPFSFKETGELSPFAQKFEHFRMHKKRQSILFRQKAVIEKYQSLCMNCLYVCEPFFLQWWNLVLQPKA